MPMTDVELKSVEHVGGWMGSITAVVRYRIVPFLFDMPGGSLWNMAGKLLRCSELRCAEEEAYCRRLTGGEPITAMRCEPRLTPSPTPQRSLRGPERNVRYALRALRYCRTSRQEERPNEQAEAACLPHPRRPPSP